MRASDADGLRTRRFACGVGSAGSGVLVGLGALVVALTPAAEAVPTPVVGWTVLLAVGCLVVGGRLVEASY